jgi:proteasome assembly chaperone (PAC2) family protein
MAKSKEPWYVVATSYFSYLIVLALGGWGGFGLGASVGEERAHQKEVERQLAEQQKANKLANTSITYADNELVSLGSSHASLKVLKLERPMNLDVTVEELQGKNIEFNAMQDGHQVFTSGVHKGKATGEFRALPGLCTIGLVNGNVLDSKSVALSIKGKPLE